MLCRRYCVSEGDSDACGRFGDVETARRESRIQENPSMANSKAASRASTSAASRKSASRHYRSSSTGFGQISFPGTQMPATLSNEPVALMAEIDGSPILIRILVGDLPAEMQSDDGYF